MTVRQGELAAALDADPDYDADEVAQLTRWLRAELLDLDVDAVKRAAGGPPPDGAKAAELLSVGGLIVILGLRRHILRAVVDAATGSSSHLILAAVTRK